MKIRTCFVLLVMLLFVGSGDLPAQETSANALDQIAGKFLGIWIGYGVSPEGEKYTSKLSFEWTLDKKFIKMNNFLTTSGPPELFALTIYGWQPVLKNIVFWAFDSNGTINEGAVKIEDNTLTHQWRAFSRNGEIKDLRSKMTLSQDDEIIFTLFEGNAPNPFTLTYKREK